MKHTYNEEQKERICQIVYDYLRDHNAWGGEMVGQNDEAQIDAVDLACELADIKDVTEDIEENTSIDLKEECHKILSAKKDIDDLERVVNRKGKLFFKELVESGKYKDYLSKDYGSYFNDSEKLLKSIDNDSNLYAVYAEDKKSLLLGHSFDDGFYTILEYSI